MGCGSLRDFRARTKDAFVPERYVRCIAVERAFARAIHVLDRFEQFTLG